MNENELDFSIFKQPSLSDIASQGVTPIDFLTQQASSPVKANPYTSISNFGVPNLSATGGQENPASFLDQLLGGYEKYSPLIKGAGDMFSLYAGIKNFGLGQDIMKQNMDLAQNNYANQVTAFNNSVEQANRNSAGMRSGSFNEADKIG